jgi:GNAT superfamily N-acetyltransferase
MRKWMNLVEPEFQQSIEVRGSQSGQMDLTLTFWQSREVVGYINYSVYQGEVHIQMIKVSPDHRRKGIGSEMLRALQREYPDTEIDVGSLTDDGAGLIGAMQTRHIPNGDVASQQSELDRIRAQLADYQQRHEDLVASQSDPGFDERRLAFIDEVTDSWNDLASREWELMQEIGDRQPTKRIFESEMGLYYLQPDGSWKRGGDGRSKGKTRAQVKAIGGELED